jgi:hypothetical protein
MKAKHLLYLTIILGILVSLSAVPALAEEGDTPIPMWVHRARLAYTGRSSGGSDDMKAYIHIRDATLDMVEGATVTAAWTVPDRTLPDGTTITKQVIVDELTNRQGIAIFSIWEGWGDYEICVTDVTKDGRVYDPELDWESCPVFTMPWASPPN